MPVMNRQTVSIPHYRKRARQMRKLAAAQTEDVRNELLALADDYEHIASLAARQPSQGTRKSPSP
jgi:(p)ppGpp synthase/HD superfamily hydrolase